MSKSPEWRVKDGRWWNVKDQRAYGLAVQRDASGHLQSWYDDFGYKHERTWTLAQATEYRKRLQVFGKNARRVGYRGVYDWAGMEKDAALYKRLVRENRGLNAKEREQLAKERGTWEWYYGSGRKEWDPTYQEEKIVDKTKWWLGKAAEKARQATAEDRLILWAKQRRYEDMKKLAASQGASLQKKTKTGGPLMWAGGTPGFYPDQVLKRDPVLHTGGAGGGRPKDAKRPVPLLLEEPPGRPMRGFGGGGGGLFGSPLVRLGALAVGGVVLWKLLRK